MNLGPSSRLWKKTQRRSLTLKFVWELFNDCQFRVRYLRNKFAHTSVIDDEQWNDAPDLNISDQRQPSIIQHNPLTINAQDYDCVILIPR